MQLFHFVLVYATFRMVSSQQYGEHLWEEITVKMKNSKFSRRPNLNSNEPVDVVMEIEINTIPSLSMKEQILITSTSIKLSWTNEFLKWTKSSNDNIDGITVSSSDVWTPDISLMNYAGNPNFIESMNKRISIFNNGQAEWRGFVEIKTYCFVNTTKYPFDTQICKLHFSAQNLDNKEQEINIRMQDGFLSKFQSNGEWNITQQENVRNYTIIQNLHGKNFSGVVLELEINRLTTYYEWKYIAPTLSLLPVVFLTLLLPVETNTKIFLSTFIVLSYSVLIQLFNESLPSTSDNISSIGQFLSLLLAWSGLALIESVAVTFYYHYRLVHSPDKTLSTTEKQEQKELKQNARRCDIKCAIAMLIILVLIIGAIVSTFYTV